MKRVLGLTRLVTGMMKGASLSRVALMAWDALATISLFFRKMPLIPCSSSPTLMHPKAVSLVSRVRSVYRSSYLALFLSLDLQIQGSYA
jgi:hypothetical protein